MKHYCNDCSHQFDVSKNKQVPDATGQDGIWIDVCPKCESNAIQDNNYFILSSLSGKDQKLLNMMAETFIQKCTANKQATNDPGLLTHYTNLISDYQILIKKYTNYAR